MSKLFVSAMFAFLSLISFGANAKAVLWTLNNVTFNDGGVATGSFTYDAGTGLYSGIAITTSGGTTLPGTTYTTNEQVTFPFTTNASRLTLIDNFGLPDLTGQSIFGLAYASALTDLGGSISLINGFFNSFEGVCSSADCSSGRGNRTTILGGQVVATVPEPETLFLIGISLVGLAATKRNRNQ